MTTREELDTLAKKEGLTDLVESLALPAVRLIGAAENDSLGTTRLGGLPDLPADLPWPRWDVSAYDEKERPKSRLRSFFTRADEQQTREPLPLTFLAQLDLQSLAEHEHLLPLPKAGTLFFFFELTEAPWGYCPTHRGSFRVLFARQGAKLERRDPPDDLEHVLKGTAVSYAPASTLPTWPTGLDDETLEAYENLNDELSNEPEHQVGGHPDQVQGEMKEACSLVSKGIYLGGEPDASPERLDRLAADADEWKLLLQLASDDDLEWMWGDLGNLYFWMREPDIEAGAWDRAWFQLQCG